MGRPYDARRCLYDSRVELVYTRVRNPRRYFNIYNGGRQMRRFLAALAVVALWSGAARAQTSGNTPKFDAADISLRARTGQTNQPFVTGGVLRGGRYDLRNATMVDLIATAYSVSDPTLIVGGPAWLERNRFDIAAKAPQGTSADNVKLM